MKAVKRRNFLIFAGLLCISSSGCSGCIDESGGIGIGTAVKKIPIQMSYSGASDSREMVVVVSSSVSDRNSRAICANDRNNNDFVFVDFNPSITGSTLVSVTVSSDLGVKLGSRILTIHESSTIHVVGETSTATITVTP